MLINAQGKDVSKAIMKLQRDNHKLYKKNRETLLRPLHEILIPSHRNSHTGMFSIQERARLV